MNFRGLGGGACAPSMNSIELRGLQSHKFKYTIKSKHNLPIAANLLNQEINIATPNIPWGGDITYTRVKQQ